MSNGANVSSGVTILLSGFGIWMHKTNAYISEFMPLITAFGILGTMAMTFWYYNRLLKQKERERISRYGKIDSDQKPKAENQDDEPGEN